MLETADGADVSKSFPLTLPLVSSSTGDGNDASEKSPLYSEKATDVEVETLDEFAVLDMHLQASFVEDPEAQEFLGGGVAGEGCRSCLRGHHHQDPHHPEIMLFQLSSDDDEEGAKERDGHSLEGLPHFPSFRDVAVGVDFRNLEQHRSSSSSPNLRRLSAESINAPVQVTGQGDGGADLRDSPAGSLHSSSGTIASSLGETFGELMSEVLGGDSASWQGVLSPALLPSCHEPATTGEDSPLVLSGAERACTPSPAGYVADYSPPLSSCKPVVLPSGNAKVRPKGAQAERFMERRRSALLPDAVPSNSSNRATSMECNPVRVPATDPVAVVGSHTSLLGSVCAGSPGESTTDAVTTETETENEDGTFCRLPSQASSTSPSTPAVMSAFPIAVPSPRTEEIQPSKPKAGAIVRPAVTTHFTLPLKEGVPRPEAMLQELYNARKHKYELILYIQMQLCSVETLDHRLRHHDFTMVPFKFRWSIFKQIVDGLHHIHSKGVIHRDLKPANIFLMEQNDATGFQIKIGDFGLSKMLVKEQTSAPSWTSKGGAPSAVEEDMESSGAFRGTRGQRVHLEGNTQDIGTSYYASPEQEAGTAYGTKTDIFSLGMILLEMLCHFKTGMERHKVLAALREFNTLPASIEEKFPVEAELIHRCVDHDPDVRPDASEILSQMEEYEMQRKHQKWLQRSQWAGEGGWHVGERFTVGESAKVTKLEKALQEKESKLQDMQAEIERLREALRDKNAEGEQDAVER